MRKKIVLVFLAFFLFAPFFRIEAQEAIFLVTHAEQVREVEEPPLTEVGQRRAKALATMLRDAGITAIYTNERIRSIQTSEPLAKALNIESKAVPGSDIDVLVRSLRTQHARDRVLIVWGVITTPNVLKALGHPAEITVRGEYDNLFVIFPQDKEAPMVLRLRY